MPTELRQLLPGREALPAQRRAPHGAGARSGWERRLRRAVVGVDVTALLAAGAAAPALADGHPWGWGPALVPAWLLALWLRGAYDARHIGPGAAELERVVGASARLLLLVVLVSYVAAPAAARGVVLGTLGGGTALVVLGRLAVRVAVLWLRRSGRCRHRVVAIGTVRDVLHLVEEARRTPGGGFDVVGACVPRHTGTERRREQRRVGRSDAPAGTEQRAEPDRRAEADELTPLGVPVLGSPSDVLAAVRSARADAVAVAGPGALSRQALRRLAWQLEGVEGPAVRLFVASALTEVAAPRITLRPLGGLPLLQVEAPQFTGARRVFKSLLDRLLAAAILLALAPLLAVLAVLVRLDSPGPALYHQDRVGRTGRVFRCLKLRTMRVGADREVAALVDANESDGLLFKMRQDPRITRVGRMLRRYSLDELPQLLNVLAGSMSLVGPRPPLPSEVAAYGDDVRRRLLVKPGMTGLWQVSGRSDLSWAESVRLDLYYVENWSPIFDLALMARTVLAVVAGRGAY